MFAALGLSLLAAGAAHADRWKIVATSTGAVAFDEDSVRSDIATGITLMATVIYYPTPQLFEGGAFSYQVENLTFQCRNNLYRRTRQAVLGPAAEVLGTREDTDWLPVGLGAASAFKTIACTTSRPPIDAEAGSAEEMMTKMRQVRRGTAQAAQVAPVVSAPPPPAAASAVAPPALRPSSP
jgi:hypothetical protein